MQAMLLANRPEAVWMHISSLPASGKELDATDRFIAAQTAQATGRRQVAREFYSSLLSDFPDNVDVWQKYIEFESPGKMPADAIGTLQRLHRQASTAYQREKASFSLATLFRPTNPNAAFDYAWEGHRLKKSRIPRWNRTRLAHSLLLDVNRPLSTQETRERARPLFIVGLPRSGTTLINSILSSHPDIASAGEQNLVPAIATALPPRHSSIPTGQHADYVETWHQSALADLCIDKKVVTDKLPSNVERCGLILAAFPDAHIIYMERNISDCATSIHMHDFEFGCGYASDFEDISHYAHSISRHANRMMELSPDRFHRISYEEMVSDPKNSISKTLSSIDLIWHPAMDTFWKNDNHTATYSERQVRSPLNTDSIGSWRRYLPAAKPLQEALSSPPDA